MYGPFLISKIDVFFIKGSNEWPPANKIDISNVQGTGKDGRITRKDSRF